MVRSRGTYRRYRRKRRKDGVKSPPQVLALVRVVIGGFLLKGRDLSRARDTKNRPVVEILRHFGAARRRPRSGLLPFRRLFQSLRVIGAVALILGMIWTESDQPVLGVDFDDGGVVLIGERQQGDQRSRHRAQTA